MLILGHLSGNNEESLQWEEDYFSSSEVISQILLLVIARL